jgi:Transglutaminase-like superfamily/TgpA N-terminal domain
LVRTLALLVLTGILVSAAWLRVEQTEPHGREAALMVALGFLPAIALALLRGRVSRRVFYGSVAAVTAVAAFLASSAAFDVPVRYVRPFDGEHDFFGPVLDGLRTGFLDFYEAELPFDVVDHPLMRSAVMMAIFGFVTVAGLLLAARRPVGAALVLVAAVGWPATLVPGGNPLRVGALTLGGILIVLYALRGTARPSRGLAQAAVVGGALVLAAVVVSSSDAVSKGAFLSWRGWDPYDRPDDPVGVDYVWNSNYTGISFPEEPTVVFKVRASGPRRGLYWRATTLDEYTGTAWEEDRELGQANEAERIEASRRDRFLPGAAMQQRGWIRQEVTVAAFRDEHLVGSAQPMRWEPPEGATTRADDAEVVTLPDGLQRDQRYTVWSYVPQARPSRLANSGTNYPAPIQRFLEVLYPVPLPVFGAPGREQIMEGFFTQFGDDFVVQAHEELYLEALDVVGQADSPYAAAVALEAWFRTEGGFTYNETPPPFAPEPPLTFFALDSKQGYCQQFAGAMAVMLRMLGVPARVAAGFTSGTYDAEKREWTVTDHNAHTWVEVFFPGFGWLPFDPTPGRGQLGATYSAVSPTFDIRDASSYLGGSALLDQIRRTALERENERTAREPGQTPGGGDTGGAATVVRDRAPSLLLLVLFVLGVALAGVVVLKAARRALRFASRDPRRIASACRRDLIAFLADQGVQVSPSATLAEVGATVEREFHVPSRPFVGAAAAARFGPPAEAEQALGRARRELRRLRSQLRRALSVPERVRGMISLRSLTL